jgi:hypothetical protein
MKLKFNGIIVLFVVLLAATILRQERAVTALFPVQEYLYQA